MHVDAFDRGAELPSVRHGPGGRLPRDRTDVRPGQDDGRVVPAEFQHDPLEVGRGLPDDGASGVDRAREGHQPDRGVDGEPGAQLRAAAHDREGADGQAGVERSRRPPREGAGRVVQHRIELLGRASRGVGEHLAERGVLHRRRSI
ncbi:hypothetical protein KN815_13915, partial [Streptomyces sp. 4503]